MDGIKEIEWLITGANGQLGRSFLFFLRANQINFLATNKFDLNITNKKEVSDFFKKYRFKYVINTAAFTNVNLAETKNQEARSVNTIGATNLANACQYYGSKFVQLSTDYVFSGDDPRFPFGESDVTNPINYYGISKCEAEKSIMNIEGLEYYIVRTAWLYSSFGNNFVTKILSKIDLNNKIEIVIDQFGQPTSTEFVVEFIYRLCNYELPNGIYHATSSGFTNWFNFGKAISKLYANNDNLIYPITSEQLNNSALRPKSTVLSHGNSLKFGIKHPNWEDELNRTFSRIEEKFKKNNYNS